VNDRSNRNISKDYRTIISNENMKENIASNK
jgi:hypothetical protein